LRAVIAVALVVCCAFPAAAATLEELTPYLSGQYYSWAEHSGGKRLLRETGPLFSTGVSVGAAFDSDLTVKGRAELFGGDIHYDGQTLPPNEEPVQTDVVYLGVKDECDIGYRVNYGAVDLEPFAGAGFRWWLRDLQNSTTQSGRPVVGYTESWETLYGRFGIRGRYQIPSGPTLFAEGGGKYPFYTGNSVDFANVGTVTFYPGSRWSGFAEAGTTFHHVKMTIFYEGFRFAPSAFKLVGTKYYFQPESSSDIIGLRLGWAFR
jgi:hypothetical protein